MQALPKWLLMFALPVALLLLAGYVYVRSQNRVLQLQLAALTQQGNILEGELYRLRQEVAGRDARIAFLTHPGMTRVRATPIDSDSTACWLYHRSADSAWYAEVSHIRKLAEGKQYRLYRIHRDEWSFIGSFEPLAETIGLQKIGIYPFTGELRVTEAWREDSPLFKDEFLRYTALVNEAL